MQKISTKKLVVCALLACVSGLLSGPLSFYFGTFKISFGAVPVMLCGIMFGPLLGGMTGFSADVINFALAPRGAYNPLFGITFALFGVISAIVYGKQKKLSLKNLLLTTTTTQLICSLLLNTAVLVVFFGATPALFITRLALNLIMIPLNAIALQISLKFMEKTHLLPSV